METRNLLDAAFETLVLKTLNDLSEYFNKELRNIKMETERQMMDREGGREGGGHVPRCHSDSYTLTPGPAEKRTHSSGRRGAHLCPARTCALRLRLHEMLALLSKN